MIEVRKTETFAAWFDALRDRQARLRVQVRIDRLATGNPGQHRALTGGVHEMKIDHGPGYRADLIGMPRATRRCVGGLALRRRQK